MQDNQSIAAFLSEQFDIEAPGSSVKDQADLLEEMRLRLIQRIDELIRADMEALMTLLYRIDVSEERLKQQLAEHSEQPAAVIMADMIIERQLQKIQTRKQFGTGTGDWSFDL